MRHGFVVCAFVLAAGLFLGGDLTAGSLEPPGPPAPTMKTIQQVEPRIPISSVPFTIAAPGNYYLTGDLTGVTGQQGITSTASYVTIDLNGFQLIGVPGSFDGIFTANAVADHVVIRNGVIRNWGGRGIYAPNVSEVHVEHLRLKSNGSDGVRVGLRSIVRDTTSSGNGGNGILVSTGSSVIGCTVASNGLSGVVAASSVVSATTATLHASNPGFDLTTSVATDCTAQQNFIGFNLINGGRVVHSQARANSFLGIFGGDAAYIEDCTADLNTDDGIRVANRTVVRGSSANGNTSDGIQTVGNGNRIEGNESTQNGGVGILVNGANNLVIQNSAFQNATEYSVVPGNQVGTISNNPTTANPWANFDQ